MREAHSVGAVEAVLGEGPVWFDGALWFVDIKARRIHRFDPAQADVRTWTAPEQPGWILPVSGGGMLTGLQSGLHAFDPATGRFDLVARIEPELPGNRLNDATVGPSGRLWFGTMDDAEKDPSGAIYRFDGSVAEPMIGGICITNGPAFSPDGTTLYHCDTLNRVVFACAIEDGIPTGSRVFARTGEGSGYPDGPVVDADGCLWLGLFGGWGVRRYDPDGELIETVAFPVANVTKVALTDDGIAYATTATKGLDAAARAAQPLAGNLFAFDAGVARQPERLLDATMLRQPGETDD